MINITVIDRKGEDHLLETPTDMGLNLMELYQQKRTSCLFWELVAEWFCAVLLCICFERPPA